MNDNDTLLKAIRGRAQKQTEFIYGIQTADRYVRTLQEAVGSDVCYRFAATNQTSFDDIIRKASQTLVYSNPEMVVEDIYGEKGKKFPKEVTLPKNTLMVFRHVLTTPQKDRDGDILRTEGAVVDPKMLLLWQHVPTSPIGKMLAIANHNSKRLEVFSAIVDLNELSHDAAVMVDNDMARFSHGFRALEFEEMKGDGEGGYDVKSFEIMEESMVSVPSNTGAENMEVLLSLVEDGKLTSPIMREYGRTFRKLRPTQVPGVEIRYTEGMGDFKRELVCGSFDELKAAADAGLIGEPKYEDKSGRGKTDSTERNADRDDGQTGTGRKVDKTGSSEEADEAAPEQKDTEGASDSEVKNKGMDEKAGRALSKANEGRVKTAMEAMTEVIEMENVPNAAKALLREALGGLKELISASDNEDETQHTPTVKEAMSIVIAQATPEQQKTILTTLQTLQKNRKRGRFAKQYRSLKGTK